MFFMIYIYIYIYIYMIRPSRIREELSTDLGIEADATEGFLDVWLGTGDIRMLPFLGALHRMRLWGPPLPKLLFLQSGCGT